MLPHFIHNRIRNVLLALMFLGCIYLPMVDHFFQFDATASLTENRTLNQAPNLILPTVSVMENPADIDAWYELLQTVARYPSNFNRYYNDHFGFRKSLVRMHSHMALSGWPAKGNVIIGRNGYLFLGEARTRESYQASTSFSTDELVSWKAELERRRDWLAAQGIDYLLVIAPEKSTIYPEFMPANIPRIGTQTRMDQLMTYFAENSNLQVIDLRPVLVRGRTEHPTYYRTDTHWNDWGAFLVSQSIIVELTKNFPDMQPPNIGDYTFNEEKMPGGDLARMMALGDSLSDDGIVVEALRSNSAYPADTDITLPPDVPDWNQPEAREMSDIELPALIMFRDSFGKSLIPFLSEHFRRSLYLHQYSFDESTILLESPDIVIQEIAERELQGSAPPESNY